MKQNPDDVGVFYDPIRFRDFSPEGEEGHKKPGHDSAQGFASLYYCYHPLWDQRSSSFRS